jgi:hypothetical protein
MTTLGSSTALSSSPGAEDTLAVTPVMDAGPLAATSPIVEEAVAPATLVVSASGIVLVIWVCCLLCRLLILGGRDPLVPPGIH